MKYNAKNEVTTFLDSYIPRDKRYVFQGDVGLSRMKYLMSFLDNPQEKVTIIHIAGTSGKGSTAYFTSRILQDQSFKVGLSVSPHLVDFRERFMINSHSLDWEEIEGYIDQIKEVVENTQNSIHGKPTYYEVVTALMFTIFADKKVDYAVVETGLGGTYDGTNVILNPNKVCIITKIGFDHMEILGNTVSEIAAQKAGIIQKGNMTFSTIQDESIKKVLDERALAQNTQLIYVEPKIDSGLKLSLLGEFQIENCALALATVRYLEKRDAWKLETKRLGDSLRLIEIPGRMQKIVYKKKEIILDGAHNPQKMAALIQSLDKLYKGQKLDFLIALKKGKDYESVLKLIIPKASSITFTAFFLNKQGFPIQAEDPANLQALATKIGYDSSVVIKDPKKALEEALKKSHDPLIITGSFYLLSELYVILNEVKNLGV